MSKKIKTDDGNVEFEVCHLGINVTDHHEQEAIWARLSQEQRRALANALRGREPGDEYVDWKAMYKQAERTCDELRSLIEGQKEHVSKSIEVRDRMRRERDEALRKKGEMVDRAVRAERERDEAVARAETAAQNARDFLGERNTLLDKYQKAERDRDEAQKALEDERIVNESMTTSLTEVARQRDEARDQWKKWEHKAGQRDELLIRAEAERDAAVARADQLRDERDDALSAGLEALGAAERQRDEWKTRAEAAEARTAPAVTLYDVEEAIRETEVLDHRRFAEFAAKAVWSLLSGDNPAVFVVRESHIAAVGIERDKDQGWFIPDRGWGWVRYSTPDEIRGYAQENIDRAAACLAVARAIEAEQAVDPIAELAQEEAGRRYSGTPNHAFVEGALWAANRSKKAQR